MTNENTSYPMLGPTSWWKLRKKFNSSLPRGEVNKSYLATALDISEVSASTNIMPKLRLIGLIDDNGKITDLALKWRNNDEYKIVCEELITRLYPSELIDAIDNPKSNKDKVIRWFQSKAKVGEPAARKMAGFYLLLVDADYTKQDEAAQTKPEKQNSDNKSAIRKAKSIGKKDNPLAEQASVYSEEQSKAPIHVPHSSLKPSLHIDIQIHISPDSSADQIDKIFASMSKHLTGFKIQ